MSSKLSRVILGSLLAGVLVLVGQAVFAAESLAFNVDISLSPKAAAKLAELHIGVTGGAAFYGKPTKAARARADEPDRININEEEVTVQNTATSVAFTGKVVTPRQIGWIQDRKVMVTVNVVSEAKGGALNLLHCNIYDGPVSEASANPPKISCDLIAGE